jgi:hypothetical protein
MALADLNSTSPAFDPKSFRDSIPHEALARLPMLHSEAGRNLHLSQFLARSPQLCVALMLAGALILLWADGNLKADFTWAMLVLVGVVGMTRNYIRGFARSLRRVPLQEAASDLRLLLLLYTGAAWGAGALLVMPALILKDEKGVIAFAAPAMAASAAILSAWPLDGWVAGALAAAGAVSACLPMLQRAMRARASQLALH